MSLADLSFDAPTHTYRHQGVVVPGVTTILKPISHYGSIPAEVLARAAARGTAVHQATEDFDRGTLDLALLDDEILPYLDAYEQFLHDKKPTIVAVESKVWHPVLRYAGAEDRELILDGERASVDVKTSVAMMPGVGPQTAAYMEAKNHGRAAKDKIKRRYGLQLKANGSYELHPYKDRADFNVFVSCLNIYRFNEAHA